MNKIDRVIELLEIIAENTKKKKPAKRKEQLVLNEQGEPHLVKIWNTWVEDLPKVVKIHPSQARFKRACERWAENPDENYWIKVIRVINRSDFCHGKGKRSTGWIADFEYLVKPDTAPRILNSNFNNRVQEKRFHGKTESGMEVWKE